MLCCFSCFDDHLDLTVVTPSSPTRGIAGLMDRANQNENSNTFGIVTGHSDVSPLVSKLRETDKYVDGLGVKNSSSELLGGNGDEFIFYEDLARDAKKG